MTRMRDRDVRLALRAALDEEHRDALDDTLFVDELDLCGYVRVDVAVLNGSLSGFELKSASDTLRRLPTQVEYYSQVLDYSTLVVAENHQDKALDLIPAWWGHTTAHWVDDEVLLEVIREPQLNPAPHPPAISLLLWRDEALEELTIRGLDKGYRSRTRVDLCNRLADELDLQELREVVRTRLKGRKNWRRA